MKKLLILCICAMFLAATGCGKSPEEIEPAEAMKPVIYLYPEAEQEISVELELDGPMTASYPAYENGWTVTASPSGELVSVDRTYQYLYWEALLPIEPDYTEGFCVAKDDTAAFLENALAALGLTTSEANEFIVFWLPRLQANAYNLIAFQTDAYTDHAALRIDPAPDTLIRVFMTWQGLEEYVEVPAQDLAGLNPAAAERRGFTAVEWGGAEVAR